MYKETDIQKLINELDIVQVIGEYVNLSKAGANYKGLSPFKPEKTPSFVVSPLKNIFKDFSTGIGGNVISFYMKINNLSFSEAVNELSRKYNVNIERVNINKKILDKNFKYYKIMEEAQNYFALNINNSKEALEYMKQRDFSIDDIKKFGIGFSSKNYDELLNFLIEKGYESKDLIEVGLIGKNENGQLYDFYRNRIMFPIHNSSMQIIGFGGRIISNDSKAPKYINSKDSTIYKKEKELFGLYNRGESIRKKGLAILMEGYLDALTAHKYGFTNSVASLGTAFTNDQALLLKKYTHNVVIAYDNDEAGKLAILKAGYILKKNDFNVRCLSINVGEIKDPDEYLRKYGRKGFIEILKTSKTLFDFLYDEFSKNLNLNDISGKREMINRFKTFFANIENKTETNLYIQKLSVELGIDKDILQEEFSKVTSKTSFESNRIKKKRRIEKVSSKKTKEEKNNDLEKNTLKFILKYENFKSGEYLKFCEKLENKKFENIIYKDILEKLKKISFNISEIDNLSLEEEEKRLITTLKLQADAEILNEEKQYKLLFEGWFLREIDFKIGIIDKKDYIYIELRRLKSELKATHNINELEDMYNKFKKLD